MDESEGRALESAWQDLLVRSIPLREQLNLGAMLRIAFEAGWDARGKYDTEPGPDPEPEEGS